MGRKRISMEMISNEKTRNSVYNARKASLIKKAVELTTLCDVKACMIIYRSSGHDDQEQPAEIWPPDPLQVNRVISAYREKRRSEQERLGGTMMKRSRKTCDLSSFLEEKKKNMEEELEKSRKRKRRAKYPTWFDYMNDFSETELRGFGSKLEKKIEAVKTKAALIKKAAAKRRLVDNDVMFDERVSTKPQPPLLTTVGNNVIVDNTTSTFDPVLQDVGYVDKYPIGLSRHESMMALMMGDDVDDYNNYDDQLRPNYTGLTTYEDNEQLVELMNYFDGSIDMEDMIDFRQL